MVSPTPPPTSGTPNPGSQSQASIEDAIIRLAGNSQDGIQTIGGFLARLAGRSAQEVMTYMTIPSTISGGPSIFQVRIGSGEVLSAGDSADFLVAFYQHSYEDHLSFLREGGVLLYDTDHVKPDLSDKRFVYVGVPITGQTIEAVGGAAKDKGKNIYVLGLLARIFNLNVRKLRGLLEERFGSKNEDILRNALLSFDAGYAYKVDNVLLRFFQFDPTANVDDSAPGDDGRQHGADPGTHHGRRPIRVRIPDHAMDHHHGTPPFGIAEIRRHLRPGGG